MVIKQAAINTMLFDSIALSNYNPNQFINFAYIFSLHYDRAIRLFKGKTLDVSLNHLPQVLFFFQPSTKY